MSTAERDEMLRQYKQVLLIQEARKAYTRFKALFERPNLDNKSFEESEIISLIKEILKKTDDRIVTGLPKETVLYRSRIVDTIKMLNNETTITVDEQDNIKGFDKYDSKEPPINISKGGRCNPAGSSYLYLSESEYSACAEVRPMNKQILSVARFEITKDLNIVDFTASGNFEEYNEEKGYSVTMLLSEIFSSFMLPVYNDAEYALTQYMSDFIRKYGYDGICYYSSNTGEKSYTIFNCCEDNVDFLDSKLVYNYMPRYNFYNLSDGEKLVFAENDFSEISKSDVDDMREKIRNQMRINYCTNKARRENNGQVKDADGE